MNLLKKIRILNSEIDLISEQLESMQNLPNSELLKNGLLDRLDQIEKELLEIGIKLE